MGMAVDAEDVRAIAGEGSTGRPHVAQAMVRRGHVRSVEEAFARFLREGGPAYVTREMLTPGEAIALIREAGGIAAIAHPGLLRLPGAGALEAFARSLATEGLEALECFTSAHDTGTTTACVGIARRSGLIPTGGSYYHGDRKRGVRVGRTRGGGRIPYAILADLRERLAARPSGASARAGGVRPEKGSGEGEARTVHGRGGNLGL
jgi:predicted metal-dependent phosphoesterase TrpH